MGRRTEIVYQVLPPYPSLRGLFVSILSQREPPGIIVVNFEEGRRRHPPRNDVMVYEFFKVFCSSKATTKVTFCTLVSV